jgi:chromosome segregation ATPase
MPNFTKELQTLDLEGLESVLRLTIKTIVQLRYRELMDESKQLKEKIEELENDHETMLETFQECQEFIDAIELWKEDCPDAPDISDYV